jgi:UDP-2-acetamido-3-amino-2,3-dideoxy-glucuronate N-acetyltransferase
MLRQECGDGMSIKVHPTALVESQDIGTGSSIWAFVHVMKGARLGANVNVGDHAFIESGAVVGDNVTIKNQVLIWEGVQIEDNCFIGPRVTFTNDRNPRSPRMPGSADRYREKSNWLARTLVRKGCSIGAAATICPGIVLGDFCMIAAGSVVTSNVPPFALMMGVPARHVADVCCCGQRLEGRYDESDCKFCGMTAAQRLSSLSQPAQQR